MGEDWRAAFPRGCRVALDVEAFTAWLREQRRGWETRLFPPHTGTVVGYSRQETPMLRIRLDGRKHWTRYPVCCVRRLEPAP
jgi:hypothetical protein